MTGSFHISLFEGTLHVNKIYVWFKIANTTHALPAPVHRQTDFTPKRAVVSRLHDTVARFRTGVKFSPRYNNRGELTPGWLSPAWHFVVVSCKQMWSHEREPEWTRSGVKVAPVSCKHPLISLTCLSTWKNCFDESDKEIGVLLSLHAGKGVCPSFFDESPTINVWFPLSDCGNFVEVALDKMLQLSSCRIGYPILGTLPTGTILGVK